MTVTKDQAQMIATLACASRPTGARQWKPDDVLNEIHKIAGRSLPAVILAVTRAAMDRNAQRPSVITSPGSHWGDTMLVTDWTPDTAPRAERCSICGYTEPVCRIRHSLGDHEFESLAMAAKRRAEGDDAALHGVVAALKESLAPTTPPEPRRGLEDYADRNPVLRARVDAVRANLPTPPMREEMDE